MVRSNFQLTCEVPSASPTATTEETCEHSPLAVRLICVQNRYAWQNSVSRLYCALHGKIACGTTPVLASDGASVELTNMHKVA